MTAFMASIHIDYGCGAFKKKHLMPLHNSKANTASKAKSKADEIIAGMVDGYKNSKWTVTITENGFIGEKDGNTNTYRDIVVKEI